MAVKVSLISLGCSKNLVDSEMMLSNLKKAGFSINTDENEYSDAIIINTCGFTETAKKESIQKILEAYELKKAGKTKAVIVSGCLAERYKNEFLKELPEADAVLGVSGFDRIKNAVEHALSGKKPTYFENTAERILEGERELLTPPHTAYLRIAEGCDNHCTYCVIPSIRGRYISRSEENILKEATVLAQKGVRELIVVAQDTARYGLDLYGERRLSGLLGKLCTIDNIKWIRIHYLYPDEIDDRLLDIIKKEDKILKYFDIPIQHISDKVLKAMNRRGSGDLVRALIENIRDEIPEAVIRTSLITGFPGETEKDFEELCAFLREAKFERAGIFSYSREEGSKAYSFKGQVSGSIKAERHRILSEVQYKVLDDYNLKMNGKTLEVICDGYDRTRDIYIGRSYADSPDIDCNVLFKSSKKVNPGDFAPVKITGEYGGDLKGNTIIPEENRL